MEISSEKVSQGKMSSIDGFDSGSSGFDFAIAFEGESDVVEVDLRVSQGVAGSRVRERYWRRVGGWVDGSAKHVFFCFSV